jgi:hypothetical protein
MIIFGEIYDYYRTWIFLESMEEEFFFWGKVSISSFVVLMFFLYFS